MASESGDETEFTKYTARSLVYSDFGDPKKVVHLKEDIKVKKPKNNEVLVKVLASPIHPVDILTIKNVYPYVPSKFPATGGCECVAEIIELGCADNTDYKLGDRVIIKFPAPIEIGTWTTYANYPMESILFKIPRTVPVQLAATLSLNSFTAYGMLKEFVNLEPGDTIIQNAANSGVGQIVHQLCRIWKINSIGVIRKRPKKQEHEEMCEKLKKLGATEVLTPEELRTTNIFEDKYKTPKLALSAVGGKTTELMADRLAKKGILVTYGAMNDQPVTGPSFKFIINDISFRGFMVTDWLEKANNDVKAKMISDLLNMVLNGEIEPPIHSEIFKIEDFKTAFNLAMKPFTGRKCILNFGINPKDDQEKDVQKIDDSKDVQKNDDSKDVQKNDDSKDVQKDDNPKDVQENDDEGVQEKKPRLE